MAREDAVQAAEANRLYWNHAASVGDISNKLGISRRALYELLEPRPAGTTCPECGTEGVFMNRSAQAAGEARCPSCQTAMETTPSAPADPPAAPVNNAVRKNGNPPGFRIGVGSAVLMGVAVGAIAALLLTNRD